MEMQRGNSGERRRRKIITRPVLVRSVKPGGAAGADYSKAAHDTPFWKAA